MTENTQEEPPMTSPETAALPIPSKKVSPDKLAVAIRTVFDDDTPGAVSAWLSVNHNGITAYMTEAQVADWTAV